MRVNKNLLLQKTDKELEDYLKPNKGYVTDAIEYAVEILTERGYGFSEEQQAYIQVVLKPEEKREVHRDYIIASNLIFASAALGSVNFLIASATTSNFSVVTGILSLLFVAGLGIFARAGITWLKYVMLVFSLIGLFALPFLILYAYNGQAITALTTLFQSIIQVIAVVFLFKAPAEKPKWNDVFDTTNS